MRAVLLAILVLSPLYLCPAAFGEVTFDWAIVGNPGNGDDSTPFGPLGGVPYDYRISKHEVTNSQYTEFLNVVDSLGTNSLGLYNPLMSNDASGGIIFDIGAQNGAKYLVKPGRGNSPVIRVSFFDAMRFVNWLHNGQGNGSTESGAYTIADGISEVRSPSATYFIPNNDEWFKAAYHKNDGPTANYWKYPTSTDHDPFSDQPPGIEAPDFSNTANFNRNDGISNGYNDGYAVTGSPVNESHQNYLTDVGAYATSVGPYGTFDQGGNVWEFTEGQANSPFRGLRGGGWKASEFLLSKSGGSNLEPTLENIDVGFRVASIPEPSSSFLALLCITAICGCNRRFRI